MSVCLHRFKDTINITHNNPGVQIATEGSASEQPNGLKVGGCSGQRSFSSSMHYATTDNTRQHSIIISKQDARRSCCKRMILSLLLCRALQPFHQKDCLEQFSAIAVLPMFPMASLEAISLCILYTGACPLYPSSNYGTPYPRTLNAK